MGNASPAVEEEVRHYAGVLRHAIRAAGLSVSEVERRLGAGPKSLRRVFSGQVDLKFKHVVAVLRIIGMSQEEFFAIAARRRRQRARRSAGADFLATFERIGLRRELAPEAAEADEADEAEGPDSEEEFDRMVEEAVDRVLKRRGLEGEPLPEDGLEDEPFPEDALPGEPPPEGPATDRGELEGEPAPERHAADRQEESEERGGEAKEPGGEAKEPGSEAKEAE
jgi:hypothetical protein